MSAILPFMQSCPFCGSKAKPEHWAHDPLDGMPGALHQFACNKCGADGPVGSSLSNAARLWNARPAADGTPPRWVRRLAAKSKRLRESQ